MKIKNKWEVKNRFNYHMSKDKQINQLKMIIFGSSIKEYAKMFTCIGFLSVKNSWFNGKCTIVEISNESELVLVIFIIYYLQYLLF